MPTLESVLDTPDPIELTGASSVCGGLTMGRNHTTGRRAFRLTVEDTIEETISLARIDAVFLEQVDVAAYDNPDCRGSFLSAGSNTDLAYYFGDPDGGQGHARTYPPLHDDDGAIARLLDECGCGQEQVRSVKFYFTVKFVERQTPPAEDRWARCQFTCCMECEPRTS
jgi:hypothetical protein